MEVGKEISKEELLEKEKGFDYAVYNPLTDTYKFERLGDYDIAHNKHAYEKLIYFEVEKGNKEKELENVCC